MPLLIHYGFTYGLHRPNSFYSSWQSRVSEEPLVLEVVAVLYPSLPDTRPPWRCSGTCRLLEAWSRRRSSPAVWGPVGTSCAPGQSTPRSWNSGRSGSARHSTTTSAGTLFGCCLPCSWSVTIYTLLSISCFCLCWGLFICQLQTYLIDNTL